MGWTLYLAGWTLGWLLLWRTRRLPAACPSRPPVAVVVPARDEVAALPRLLGPLLAQLRRGDEVVVVDDHSTDATAAAAGSFGATVLAAPDLPAGWVGKPHACWAGAAATAAPVLLFLDADVHPGAQLVDGVAAALAASPGAIVSVQPWHDAERPGERVGLLANVVALMGCGRFTVLGGRVRANVAFGPVLAVERETYDRIGGHAHPDVRGSLTEDIALARAAGHSEVYTHRDDASFRMYPGGLGDLLAGWSRTIAAGVGATRWWLALGVTAWVWSLAGGPLVGWPAYPLSALQVWVLGRRAGRAGPVLAAAYPLAVLVLVVVLAGAVVNRVRGVTTWRGRRVPAT